MDNTQTNGQGLCSTKALFTETGGQPQGCGLQPLALEQSRTGNLRTAVTSERQKQHLCGTCLLCPLAPDFGVNRPDEEDKVCR